MTKEPDTNMSPTQKLAVWFSKHCNEDWEHTYGIAIDTLDNPGWSLKINLEDTELSDVPFAPVKTERSEWDWLECRVEGKDFLGFGGVYNLDEMIIIFLDWAAKSEG